jgi:hypothetical protein
MIDFSDTAMNLKILLKQGLLCNQLLKEAVQYGDKNVRFDEVNLFSRFETWCTAWRTLMNIVT